MPGILEALSGLMPRWPLSHDEAKASRVGGLVSFSGPGEPVWSPRDYATFAREGFAQNAIVYRSVRMISEAAASIPLMLFEGDHEHDVHPFLELLAQPCPGSTGTDLLESFYGHLLVAGNAYIEAVGVEGSLRELHVLRPDRMRVIPGADGWPEGYEYTVGGNSVRFSGDVAAGVRPVLHMRLFHPLNDHYGMSPIEAAATAIDIHNEAANWNKALLDNAARPSGALVYAARDAHLTGEQYDRLKSELEAGFAGARNAGRPLLLEGGLDWKPLSLSPKEMDFIEAKNAAAREIALAMGVPPMLLGIPGDNTYSNYQEANRSFWRQTVLPLANRTAKALSRWLSPGFGAEGLVLRPDLDQIEALSMEREALWARIEKASFLTRDEKRAAAGYDALGEEAENTLGPFPEAGQEAKRYDPSQPRAPEGSPNGGQWVGDGGSGSGASGGDEKPVRVAQADGGSGYPVNILDEESQGGHTWSRHVAKTEAYLKARVTGSRVNIPLLGGAGEKRAGSFTSLEAANKLVNSTLASPNNASKLEAFARGDLLYSLPVLYLVKDFPSATGYEAYSPDGEAQPEIRPTNSVRVRILRTPDNSRGWFVHSAWPTNHD